MHWMDRSNLTCIGCGHVSRNMGEEARHRHNFPLLCRKPLIQCDGTRKDGEQCQRMTRRDDGRCSWHSHQKRQTH